MIYYNHYSLVVIIIIIIVVVVAVVIVVVVIVLVILITIYQSIDNTNEKPIRYYPSLVQIQTTYINTVST
jgi:flagellar biosynthesis protein FliQ